jgi:hypothetical protein
VVTDEVDEVDEPALRYMPESTLASSA